MFELISTLGCAAAGAVAGTIPCAIVGGVTGALAGNNVGHRIDKR